jgi:hypothetical protein
MKIGPGIRAARRPSQIRRSDYPGVFAALQKKLSNRWLDLLRKIVPALTAAGSRQ